MSSSGGGGPTGPTVHLLGSPRIGRPGEGVYRFRSRKSWAVLAYLLLGTRAPSRGELAGLLFAGTEDPLRALRWCLAEIRRGLGDDCPVGGDPVVLTLPDGVIVDASVVTRGSWREALDQAGLGQELLSGLAIRGAPAFETWLLSERRRVAAASEAILHEAALALAAQGRSEAAREVALRAAAMSPLDENHQALLIRLYRLAGEETAATQQFQAYAALLQHELGVQPGETAREALQQGAESGDEIADEASIRAVVEAGSAAVSAGASKHGVTSLRTAVRLADTAGSQPLRVHARLVLAEALIHSVRGLDQEGLTTLHEAGQIALAVDDRAAVARVRAELGYVDFLRGRYNRAAVWLEGALGWGQGSPTLLARAATYLGSVESDRGNYPRALSLLNEAVRLAGVAGEPRREAYARSMVGRLCLLRGDLGAASEQLDRAITLAEGDHWLAFLPLPQALVAEVQLARRRVGDAATTFQQAFARACQLNDPCWEGFGARGLALVAEARGDTERAFALLGDARGRCNRHADPYVWLDVYILDTMCALGRRHGHPETRRWAEEMRDLASRSEMKELTVRSLLHAAALGGDSDAAAARLLAADIDNPVLTRALDGLAVPAPPQRRAAGTRTAPAARRGGTRVRGRSAAARTGCRERSACCPG